MAGLKGSSGIKMAAFVTGCLLVTLLGFVEGFDMVNNSWLSVLFASVGEAGELGPWTEMLPGAVLRGLQAGYYVWQNAVTGNQTGSFFIPAQALLNFQNDGMLDLVKLFMNGVGNLTTSF